MSEGCHANAANSPFPANDASGSVMDACAAVVVVDKVSTMTASRVQMDVRILTSQALSLGLVPERIHFGEGGVSGGFAL